MSRDVLARNKNGAMEGKEALRASHTSMTSTAADPFKIPAALLKPFHWTKLRIGQFAEEQAFYECRLNREAGLLFRNTRNARPRSPVPSNRRLLGSGVALASIVKDTAPVAVLVRLQSTNSDV